MISGCSGSGKTTLLEKMISKADEVMTRSPSEIIIFYNHMQQAYRDIQRNASCPVKLLYGSSNLTPQFKTTPGTLVVIDDMQASHSNIVSEWFTRLAHHLDSSVIYLVQNVFDKSLHHRTINLNATHIVLFKNPRDGSQVTHLDKQVFPGGGGLLTAAYRDITQNIPHSYVVADFNQATPDSLRIRNTLFPHDDFPNAFAYVANTE